MGYDTPANALKRVLADSYALYLKTQNYHWNVEGPSFRELHLMFEEQYTDLFTAIDVIAELIRGLGEKAPGTFEEFAKHTIITPGDAKASSDKMLSDLASDQERMLETLTKALHIAQEKGDEIVAGFLIERMTAHRKAAWMLKSSLR